METVDTTPNQVEAETVGSTPLVGRAGELNATEEAEEAEADEEAEGDAEGKAAAPQPATAQSAAAQPATVEPAAAESEAAIGTEAGTEGGTEGSDALGQRAAEDGGRVGRAKGAALFQSA